MLILSIWKFILTKREEKNAWRTKIDFFVLTKRSFLINVSRVLVIWKDLDIWCRFFLDCRFFLHCRFLLDCKFIYDWEFLIADSFLIANFFAFNDFLQLFFIFNANVKTIIENKDIRLLEIILLNNEFEEVVCCSKRFCTCKMTRDKY
jgi:hypothetical protein